MYYEAEDICNQEGATLSIPRSQKQLTTMLQTISTSPDSSVRSQELWLGFYYALDNYFTLDGNNDSNLS
jgi:hypothetical protein